MRIIFFFNFYIPLFTFIIYLKNLIETLNLRLAYYLPIPRLQESENVLSVIRSGVEGLRSVMHRIRAEISDPHRQIAMRTRQLAALSQTIELLHNVIRVLKLTGAPTDLFLT